MADLIKFRKGNKENLPNLRLGEPGVALDEGRLYIGGVNGNIKIPNMNDVRDISEARVDADGNVFTTLKERLDTKEQSFSTQLAQKVPYDKLPYIDISYRGAVPEEEGGGDCLAIIQAAVEEAKNSIFNVAVRIPRGTFLLSGSLKLPDGAYLLGSGEDVSILKLMDHVPSNAHALTNSQNTGSILTNNGNKNIVVKDLTVDGNGRRPVTITTMGCAIQFANVENLYMENVHAKNGMLHCIDITAAEYAEGKPSNNVTLMNCTGSDPVHDDAITTHFSKNITIINPQTYMTITPGSTTQGLEIDEGCEDVFVYGGYARGFTKGLQIKGHDNTPASRRISVVGFTSEGNLYNYDIQHGTAFNNVDSPTAFNVYLLNCTSIKPKKVNDAYSNLRALEIRSYSGVKVENFTMIGENLSGGEGDGNIRIYGNARNIFLDTIYCKNIKHIYGVITINSDAGKNISVKNIVADDCPSNVVYVTNPNGIDIDSINAVNNTGTTVDGVIKVGNDTAQSENTFIKNIQGSGYSNAVVDFDGVNSISVPLKKTTVFGREERWIKANSAGGSTIGTQDILTLGWVGGNQNLAEGEGLKVPFKFRVKNGSVFEGAFIEMVKTNGADDDTSMDMYIGTRHNSDSGTKATRRLKISSDGNVSPATDNEKTSGTPSLRWSTIYAGTGAINTSDEREKQDISNIPEEWLDAWSEVNYSRFKFKESVKSKGENARWHIGLIAQEIDKVFKKHGLNAFEIGILCFDEWEKDGEKFNLWGIRADECQFLEMALLRREIERLKAQLEDTSQ